jgi:hypothetical protein
MHGTEHRVSERRALRLSAPRQPVYPASASSPSDAPQPLFLSKTGPFARNGLSLTRVISACADSIPGSKVLACHFAHSLAGLPARSAFWLRRQPLVCPSYRLHPRLKPVAFFTGLLCRLCRPLPLPFRSFHSLRIKASTGFATIRSAFRSRPIFVRSPQPFHLKIRLRIIVPDPLHLRRLAVPQTSWNLLHYDPMYDSGQRFFPELPPISTTSFCLVSNQLPQSSGGSLVHKTSRVRFVTWQLQGSRLPASRSCRYPWRAIGVGRRASRKWSATRTRGNPPAWSPMPDNRGCCRPRLSRE